MAWLAWLGGLSLPGWNQPWCLDEGHERPGWKASQPWLSLAGTRRIPYRSISKVQSHTHYMRAILVSRIHALTLFPPGYTIV